VIKTSIQIDALDKNLRENKNFVQTISNIHKKSGFKGFFRGISTGILLYNHSIGEIISCKCCLFFWIRTNEKIVILE
jgi:hypothetical protein